MRRILYVLTLAMLASCSGREREFVRVSRGAFRTTLVETGELQAVRYRVIVMPFFGWRYGRPKITHLEPEGKRVKAGDAVGQIETAGVAQELARRETDLAIEQANLNQMKVQHDSAIRDLEARIRTAEASVRRAKIDQERVKFESETKRKLSTLDLEVKERNLKKLQIQLASKRIEQGEDLRIQQAKIRKIEAEIAQAKDTIDRFTLRAPAPGLIEYRQHGRPRRKVAVGDQLRSGNAIIGLPDLSQMKVLTTVSEIDIDKMAVGQRAFVRLDAFPKFVYEGHITEISRISREKSREDHNKVFDVEVLLEKSDKLLRPGMTVRCEFLVADLDDALYVDSDCIRREGDGYVVYVKKLLGLKRVPVKLGPRSAKGVVIRGDIKAGAQVARVPGDGAV